MIESKRSNFSRGLCTIGAENGLIGGARGLLSEALRGSESSSDEATLQ